MDVIDNFDKLIKIKISVFDTFVIVIISDMWEKNMFGFAVIEID